MKAIDLHTHTICTIHDQKFTFSMEHLNRYVIEREIAVLGITNHNTFDINQFNVIKNSVETLVIPGIEIDLEGGHLLLLCDPSEVIDFSERCTLITNELNDLPAKAGRLLGA